VPWIHCIEYIFFIIQNYEQPALALKTEFALKFFTILKYFLSFRIFEQLELAPENKVCPESFKPGGRPPHPPRTPLAVWFSHRSLHRLRSNLIPSSPQPNWIVRLLCRLSNSSTKSSKSVLQLVPFNLNYINVARSFIGIGISGCFH